MFVLYARAWTAEDSMKFKDWVAWPSLEGSVYERCIHELLYTAVCVCSVHALLLIDSVMD